MEQRTEVEWDNDQPQSP